jgi:hypothetical protein
MISCYVSRLINVCYLGHLTKKDKLLLPVSALPSLYLFYELNSWHAGFDCGSFCIPDLDIHVLNLNLFDSFCLIWIRTHGGFDRSVVNVHSSNNDLRGTLFCRCICQGLCCPTSNFVFAFWIMVTCKTNTILILMHQIRISTTQVSSVILRSKVGNPENCERANKNQRECHDIEPNLSKDRATLCMHERDNPSF